MAVWIGGDISVEVKYELRSVYRPGWEDIGIAGGGDPDLVDYRVVDYKSKD